MTVSKITSWLRKTLWFFVCSIVWFGAEIRLRDVIGFAFGCWAVIGDSDFWKRKRRRWHQWRRDPYNAFGGPRESLDKKIHQLNRAGHFHHPQIKADLKSGQRQQVRILELTTRKLVDQMGQEW